MYALRSLALLSLAFFARALPHEARGPSSLTILPAFSEFDPLTITVVYDITNVGSETLRLVKYGTVLDDQLPTKSFFVLKNGADVPFTGVKVCGVHAFPETVVD